MTSNKKNIFIGIILILVSKTYADIGIPVQLKLKSPSGTYPTDSGLTVTLSVLSPSTSCILREEVFSSQSISSGNLSLNLGSGSLGVNNPGISLNQAFDNTTSKTGLSCVDSNNNVTSTGQSYSPSTSDHRVLRLHTVIGSDTIIVNFNMRSNAYAIHAESVGGKQGADILVKNNSSQLSQTNLNNLLLDSTRYNNLLNFATSGIAASATAASTAVSFTGSLAGDVSGSQGATSVDKIKGIAVSSTAPTTGQVLQYNGSQYVPVLPPTAPVTSVSGKTGAVSLVSSDISGLGTAAAVNTGTSSGQVPLLDGSGKLPTSTLPSSVLSASSTAGGDVSGILSNLNVDKIKGVVVSSTAPASGQVLQYNGSQYVPITPPTAPVTSVSGKTGTVSLVSSDISGLGTAAAVNTGTSSGQVPLLDGSGKLPTSTLPSSVLSASSTAGGDVSGVFTSLTVNSVGGKTSSQISTSVNDTQAASASNVASSIMKRDASGNVAVAGISSTNNSTQNIYIFEATNSNSVRLKAPTSFSNYILTLPVDDGVASQVLQTDGSGNLSWVSPAVGSVTNVTANAPLASSGGSSPNITISQADSTTSGYLTSSDWSTFNSKQNSLGYTPLNPSNNLSDVSSVSTARTNLGLGGAAVLNVGTVASTVAAGNDSRITGALQSSTFNGYVVSSNCTTSQSLYWNSVSSQFLCQSISFPVSSVTASAPLASSGGANPNISLAQANASNHGYLSSSDWTVFNNKLGTASVFSGDVTGTYNTISVDKIRGVAVNSAAPASGQVMVYNGTDWKPAHGLPYYTRITANQTFNSTTLANATNLSFAVVSGNVYRYKFHIMYTAALATTGARFGLTYPAVNSSAGMANIPSGADGTGAYFQGLINTSGDSVLTTASPAATPTVLFATVEGVIHPSANGTVQLQAATEVNASSVIIRTGSFVEITQIPP